MRTITIIYDRSSYTYKWLKALKNAGEEFKELGYKIKYQSIWDYLPFLNWRFKGKPEKWSYEKSQNKKHDIVMVAFHHITEFCSDKASDKRKSVLENLKNNSNMVIWLDTADSTGTCMFDVMPYVDLYLKKQLQKDRTEYLKPFYGGRPFCDYYHNLLNIEDPEITQRDFKPLKPEYLNKLGVSWNVGLGDLFAKSKKHMVLHPNRCEMPSFVNIDTPKSLDLQYRGSGYSPIAGYPRSESKRRLEKFEGIKMSDVTKKIPYPEYIAEGKNSKSILSPFGWGEICGRDFETFVYGACMIKQSMENIDTYPPVYREMETYVPLKWDFSDFDEKIKLSSSKEYQDIARKGQEQFKFYLSKDGRRDFAKHIISQIEKIYNP